jgi:hypothetical protein
MWSWQEVLGRDWGVSWLPMALHALLAAVEGFMDVRTVCSGVVTAGLMLAFVPLGCGGASGVQEQSTIVYRPLEIGATLPTAAQRVQVEALCGINERPKPTFFLAVETTSRLTRMQ